MENSKKMAAKEIFEKEIVVFRSVDENDRAAGGSAWRYGDMLCRGMTERAYRAVDADQLCAFVRSALAILDEYDLVNVYPGEQMPRDARVGIVYQPSYAVIALAIYLKLELGEEHTAWMNERLARLMEAAFRHGIVGHGFESGDMLRRTMLLFGRAGLRAYLEQAPVLSGTFDTFMREELARIREAVAEGRTDYAGGTLSGTPTLAAVLGAIEGKERALFVYGTLMRGQRAADQLADSLYAGRAFLHGYAMYDLGSYPGVAEKPGETVIGELWLTDDETLARIDRYEGEGTLYRRETVQVQVGREYADALVYIYNRAVDAKPMRVLWGTQDDTPVWYACYGSNLSARRFACYLLGGMLERDGLEYGGCTDRTVWQDERVAVYPGSMYFGNESRRWDHGGAAFFRPDAGGQTVMRLYRITYGQLKEIQLQEGASDAWYGRLVFLGEEDSIPVYTLTSESPRPVNQPCERYLNLIRTALIRECGLREKDAERYLKDCVRRSALKRRK